MEEALEDWMERRCEAKRCVNCGKKGVIDQQDSASAVR
jgi:Zn ribbon nucleic-acid-binding protein